jgi:hypothetical protein
MKKFVLLLFVVALVISCKNPTEDDDPQVDSRLVGGRWHDRAVSAELAYFEFSADSLTTAYYGAGTESTTQVYTSDGKVYATGTETVILTYKIVSGTEYDNAIAAAIEANDEVLQYNLEQKDKAAESGNLASFTFVDGSTAEWGRWALVPGE